MAENAELKAVIKAEVEQAVAAFKKFDNKVKETAKTINTGSTAATDFTRTLQDLPFGIQGVGNNIQQLASSFGQLKKETGSGQAALKAMVSSLAGPGGLAFGVTAVTTALTFAEVGLSMWTRKSREAKEKADEFAKAQNSVAVAVEKQRVEVENLVKIARGDIGTKQEQALALDKLNKLIPDNIGHLTKQNIKTAEGTAILTSYVKALQARATAELLISKVAELNVQQLEAQKKVSKEILELRKASGKIQRELAGALFSDEMVRENQAKEKEILSDFFQFSKDIQQQVFDFSQQIETLLPKALPLDKTGAGKTIIDKIIPPDFKAKAAEFKTELINLKIALQDALQVGDIAEATGIQNKILPDPISKDVRKNALDIQKSIADMAENIRASMQNVAVDAIENFVDAVLEGKDIAKSFQEILKDLIKNLVKLGIRFALNAAFAGSGEIFNAGLSAALGGIKASGLGAQQSLVAVGRISGQDILLSVERTKRTNFING